MNLPPTVVEMPLRDSARVLYFDLKAYESGRKFHRNVLAARNAVAPAANFITEQTLVVPSSSTPTEATHTFQGTPGNVVTVMAASAPLRVRVTRDTGVCDLGLQTLMILTSPCLSITLVNESAQPVDVELIHA